MNNKVCLPSSDTSRVAYLDGLRGLAIIMVVLFHSFARWDDLVPYGGTFSDFILFEHGNLGVQLFFIISGYVILMTLEKSRDFSNFIFKRWLRLFPAMLICSIVIFITADLFPYRPNGTIHLKDLIPGLLFIEPELIELTIDNKQKVLEGSFWSLFVEVKFYILAGFSYFIFGKNKMIMIIIGLFFTSALHLFLSKIIFIPVAIETIFHLLSIQYFGWFAIGALFYEYSQTKNKLYLLFALSLFVVVARQYDRYQSESMIIKILIILAFFLPLIGNNSTRFLQHRFFLFFGFISYPLYLLHENMMMSMIISSGKHLPWMPYILMPVIPIVLIATLSYIVATYIEPFVRSSLKKSLINLSTSKS